MATLDELRGREEECEREWQWLVEALNSIAEARSADADAHVFSLMQHQAMAVGQRRVELSLQRAAMERSRQTVSVF